MWPRAAVGGGCGVCRVRVWSGQFRSKAMSKAHINEEDLRQGVVLACRVFPQSDMEISPKSRCGAILLCRPAPPQK